MFFTEATQQFSCGHNSKTQVSERRKTYGWRHKISDTYNTSYVIFWVWMWLLPTLLYCMILAHTY